MPEISVVDQNNKQVGKQKLNDAVFGLEPDAAFVHRVYSALSLAQRAGTHSTKTRAEVSGGGKKPWKQKGTGRARHGSRRSPIWSGGGIAHGPRSDKDYSVKINKKVRAKALASVLSKKFTDNEVIFVDALAMTEPKTKAAKAVLASLATAAGQAQLATKRKNAAVVVLSSRDLATEKSFRNFGNIEVVQAKDINPVDLLTYKYVVVSHPVATVEILAGRVLPTTPTKN